MEAIVIPADTGQPVTLQPIAPGSLEDLQHLVGGYIESVPWPRDHDATVYFNAEGKFMGLAYNARATLLLQDRLMPGDYIAGPLIIVGHDGHGETADLPADLREQVASGALTTTEDA